MAARPTRTSDAVNLRRKTVWDMRMAGFTMDEIARKMSIPSGTVKSDIHRELNQIDITRQLESEVIIDLARLERLLRSYWTKAMEGDLDSAIFCMKVLERKSKLLGLDAPKRVDVRQLVVEWAVKEGFDPEDVLPIASQLIPGPNTNGHSWHGA